MRQALLMNRGTQSLIYAALLQAPQGGALDSKRKTRGD
jgi:hypothetical protein